MFCENPMSSLVGVLKGLNELPRKFRCNKKNVQPLEATNDFAFIYKKKEKVSTEKIADFFFSIIFQNIKFKMLKIIPSS